MKIKKGRKKERDTERERDETEKGKDEWVEEGETKIELPTQGSPIILLWLIFFSFE